MRVPLKHATDYFTLYEVAEGVYAAIVEAGVGAWGNAGIIDLGDQALVFDTFATPAAARVLRETAGSITGHSVTYALNSHRHADHVGGNMMFRDVPIVATARTRDLIAALTPRFLGYLREQGNDYLQEIERQIADAWSEGLREGYETQRDEIRAICAALSEMELTLPTLTFEERLYFHGTKRAAHFLNCGANHTPSDAVLWLPEDGVLFAGDIVQVRTHPSMGQGDHAHWLETMEQLATLAPTWVVPGHGEVGSAEDITLMTQYVQDATAAAQAAATEGIEGEQLLRAAIPEPYTDYAYSPGWGGNLLSLLPHFTNR